MIVLEKLQLVVQGLLILLPGTLFGIYVVLFSGSSREEKRACHSRCAFFAVLRLGEAAVATLDI